MAATASFSTRSRAQRALSVLPIRQEHVGEESTKAIMRLHIGFDPDGSPRRGQALSCGLRLPAEAHDRGDILAELLALTRRSIATRDLGSVDADQSDPDAP